MWNRLCCFQNCRPSQHLSSTSKFYLENLGNIGFKFIDLEYISVSMHYYGNISAIPLTTYKLFCMFGTNLAISLVRVIDRDLQKSLDSQCILLCKSILNAVARLLNRLLTTLIFRILRSTSSIGFQFFARIKSKQLILVPAELRGQAPSYITDLCKPPSSTAHRLLQWL